MAESRTHTHSLRSTGLHVCPSCDSLLVQPAGWAPAALQSWQIDLRCPECEWTGRAIATQDEVDELDLILDDSAHAIARDLLTVTSPAFDDALTSLLNEGTNSQRTQ